MGDPHKDAYVAQEILLPGTRVHANAGSAVSLDDSGEVGLIGAAGNNRVIVVSKSLCPDRERPGSWVCWIVTAQLNPGMLRNDAKFGDALGISADGFVAIVAAPAESGRAVFAGAAFIYSDHMGSMGGDPGMWVQKAELSIEAKANDFFGYSAAIRPDGTCAVVGAPGVDLAGVPQRRTDCGAAYVFAVDVEGRWGLVMELSAEDGTNGDAFGSAVAFSSDSIFVSATKHSAERGAVYVYTQAVSGTWVPAQKLEYSSDILGSPASFGNALSVRDNVLFVGASRMDDGTMATNTGSVYVFNREKNIWSDHYNKWVQVQIIRASDRTAFDFFGTSVALSADLTAALIGSPMDDHTVGDSPLTASTVPNAGAVYMFELQCEDISTLCAWVQTAKMLPSDFDKDDQFGGGVAIGNKGDIVLVSATRADDPSFDCAYASGCPDPTDFGVVYAYVNKCQDLVVPHSDFDVSRPCKVTVGLHCSFKCDEGFTASSAEAEALAAHVAPYRIGIPSAYASIECRVQSGAMQAAWVHTADTYCLPVGCPSHSSPVAKPDGTADMVDRSSPGNECICDMGYVGAITWVAASAQWTGECQPLSCEPRLIENSNRASSPCRGETHWQCRFECDSGYRVAGPGGPVGQAECQPDGVFAKVGCELMPCPLHSEPNAQHSVCTCQDGWDAAIQWDRANAVWPAECEGDWVVSERSRTWVLNVLGLLVLIAAIFFGFKYRRKFWPASKRGCCAELRQKVVPASYAVTPRSTKLGAAAPPTEAAPSTAAVPQTAAARPAGFRRVAESPPRIAKSKTSATVSRAPGRLPPLHPSDQEWRRPPRREHAAATKSRGA
jgi:hypothetical protein